MKTITTIADLIEEFGGPSAMAEWAQVVPGAVSNWVERGNIPAGLHLQLDRECRRRGIEVDDSVYGLRPVGTLPSQPRRRTARVA